MDTVASSATHKQVLIPWSVVVPVHLFVLWFIIIFQLTLGLWDE